MLRKKRKYRLPRRRIILLTVLFTCLCTVIGFFWFLTLGRSHGVVSPVPKGVIRIAPKSGVQREKDIEKYLLDNGLVMDGISRSSDSALIISLKDNGDVYVSEDSYSSELPSLQRIISQLTMEGKRFKRLDLRFERPIIVL